MSLPNLDFWLSMDDAFPGSRSAREGLERHHIVLGLARQLQQQAMSPLSESLQYYLLFYPQTGCKYFETNRQ